MDRNGAANSHTQAAAANDFRHASVRRNRLRLFILFSYRFFFPPRYMCELESSALIMALLHTHPLTVIASTGALHFTKNKNKINQLLQLRDESVILNTFAVSHTSNPPPPEM